MHDPCPSALPLVAITLGQPHLASSALLYWSACMAFRCSSQCTFSRSCAGSAAHARGVTVPARSAGNAQASVYTKSPTMLCWRMCANLGPSMHECTALMQPAPMHVRL